MKKKVQDLRFTPIFFEDSVAEKLGYLVMHLGYLYLSKANYEFQMENTDIIEIFIANIDNPKTSKEEYYRLGDAEIDNIGATRLLISEKYFLSIDDNERRKFLIHNIHNALIKYATHFNESVSVLEETYQSLANSDFFVKHTKELDSPNRMYKCWIERQVSFEKADYRFALLTTKTNIIEHFHICSKVHLNSQKLKGLNISDLIAIPRFFDQQEWLNNIEFKAAWGREQYIFNAETKRITVM